MGRNRLELQTLLEDVLGSSNVYFQPPPSLQMIYPCIVYQREAMDVKFANDSTYLNKQRYSITVIARDPDNEIPLKVAQLRYCLYDRFYVADNLNHDVFTLYF